MNEQALTTLEYHKIRDSLTELAGSEPGKRLCRQLLPSNDADEIRKNQRETTDAAAVIRQRGDINFSSLRDLGGCFKRLAIGAAAGMEELYAIGLLLRLAKKAAGHKEYEDGEEDSLSPYFTGLFPAEDLEREISRCLAGPDWMADEASPKLGQIRRKKKNLLSNVHGELNRILQAHREYLMDAVVTMRNGSYCLPIKSEYKNRVSGVVHDQSATGSTVFIEPMAVIRMNNEIKELEIAEAKEVETVLTLLSSLAMGFTHELTENLSILARLDFIFAKARLARIQKATEPVFNTKGELSILEGRHPLLDPEAVVPIDISLGDTYDLLIVTGPNTGGKTVSLKTVGLFTRPA